MAKTSDVQRLKAEGGGKTFTKSTSVKERFNAILSGTAGHDNPQADRPLYASYDPDHQRRALALAASWYKEVEQRGGGERGLRRAVTLMEESLNADYPLGMVRAGAAYFETHYLNGLQKHSSRRKQPRK
jgi:hypothetical protein